MPIEPKRVVKELGQYQRPQEGRHPLVRLDFNENTQGFPPHYPGEMPHVLVSAYPEYDDLITRLAAFYNVDDDTVMLTNGSDEGLSIITQTFVEAGEALAVVSSPCFSMIPHCLRLAGAEMYEVPVLPDLSFNIEAIEAALQNGATIAMFATPENPTGAILEAEIVSRWVRQYPQCLFVIDEAYGEFGGTTALPLVATADNLLVTKTFSKAWGMAGLRLGIVFGQPYLIEYLQRVRLPYSVNSAAVWTASKLLENSDQIKLTAAASMQRKQQLEKTLKNRGYRVDCGAANSLLLGAGINAQLLTDFCRRQGVLVRNRSKERSPMWGKLRISVGTDEEHEHLLRALDAFSSSYGVLFDLDGTLVDTSKSFDAVVAELVQRHSGKPLPESELKALREEGGFNDDWVATRELLRRRGFEIPMPQISAEALKLYLELAPMHEELMIELELLSQLRRRHPLFIVTGRSRAEYEPIWADKLNPCFHQIYCLDDIAGHAPKPAPDYLLQAKKAHNLQGGVYIGNSVDDMWAARDAGLDRIAITSSLSAEALHKAGAQIVISSMEQLSEIFML